MTQGDAQAAIVVGVDGSSAGQDAVDWAAAEAAAQHRPLSIVHGFIWPLIRPKVPLGPMSGGPAGGGLQAAAQRVLAEAEARARSMAPDVEVTTKLVVAAPAPALLDQAKDADLVVVGSRGLGGFAGLLIGSVGVKIAAHAPCPVVVVRPRSAGHPHSSSGRVVVGVDGSEISGLAVDFAFEVAARRGVGVTAVPIPAAADPGCCRR